MTLPESVALKLERAREHAEALKDAVRAFLDGDNPYAAHRVVRNQGTDHVLIWDRYIEPPRQIGLILGDAIHNLRSSLDHMVVALAEAGAAAQHITMTRKKITNLQFPVVKTREQFVDQLNRGRLLYVPAGAQEFIESRQAYRVEPRFFRRDLLTELTDLDNADKHRALATACLNTAVIKLNWPQSLRDVDLQPPTNCELPRPGTELGRFVFSLPQDEDDVPIDFDWGLGIVHSGRQMLERVEFTMDTYMESVIFVLNVLSNWT